MNITFIKKLSSSTLLFSFLGLALLSGKAFAADWVPTGNNIYYTAGNVGIGTSNPFAKFHVAGGDIYLSNNFAYRVLDTSGTARVAFTIDSSNNQLLGGASMPFGGDMVFRVPGFNNGAVRIQASTGNVLIGSSTPLPSTKFYVDGQIGSKCSSGTAETGYISTIGWHSLQYSSICTWGPNARIILTQDNSGTGDLSIISLRIKKNSVTMNGFAIEFYVNAVPAPGTTKFNWSALLSP